MAHAAVSLPTISVAGRTSNVQVSVDGSLLLRLPEGSSSLTTSHDLMELITARHVWICRTGACHVSITVSLNGEPFALVDETPLAEWVGGCEIWQRLGLRLQYCGVERSGDMNEMIFSLQHPDLSSGLVAPKGVASADFRAWLCRIDVCFEDSSHASKSRSNKGSSSRRKQKRCSSPSPMVGGHKRLKAGHVSPPSSLPEDDGLYRCLAPTDRQAVDDFVLSMGFGPEKLQQGRGAMRLTMSADARDAVQVAIKTVVCGQRQSSKGVAIVKSDPSHCLTSLAPAVFHIPYLKAS
ncbi:RasGEF protein [Ophiocordyceps camponoti-floridani]|uniref:RasGEF protein n=1 Tax=Ophiocordyceps camponoti-floridani TaxID=2030778 RepID=A0A8H4Q1G7_9HYPO|nr:RasGEF protein [Ophiocordyceps camponoti-floridani]